MPSKTETLHAGEWLVSDAGNRSRDEATVTVALNTPMPSGTVLGKITASGKFIKSLNAASDGSQNSVAVLIYDIESGPARDVQAAIYYRDCEVWGAKLNDGAGVLADQITELDARGIVVR
jgi:hypothetical protein